jgi:hypothetical protein
MITEIIPIVEFLPMQAHTELPAVTGLVKTTLTVVEFVTDAATFCCTSVGPAA